MGRVGAVKLMGSGVDFIEKTRAFKRYRPIVLALDEEAFDPAFLHGVTRGGKSVLAIGAPSGEGEGWHGRVDDRTGFLSRHREHLVIGTIERGEGDEFIRLDPEG